MISEKFHNAEVSDLKKVKIKRPPKAGARWQGVPFHTLVTEFVDTCERRGYTPGGLTINVNKKKDSIAFSFYLKSEMFKRGFPESHPSPFIGVVASNKRAKAMKVYVGGVKFFANKWNSFVFEELAGRRFESCLVIESEVQRLVGKWLNSTKSHLMLSYEHMKNSNLTQDQVRDIVERAAADKGVSANHAMKLSMMFKNSSDKSTFTFCRMFNDFIKKTAPASQMERMLQLFYLLPRWENTTLKESNFPPTPPFGQGVLTFKKS